VIPFALNRRNITQFFNFSRRFCSPKKCFNTYPKSGKGRHNFWTRSIFTINHQAKLPNHVNNFLPKWFLLKEIKANHSIILTFFKIYISTWIMKIYWSYDSNPIRGSNISARNHAFQSIPRLLLWSF
jgi:hypothetical protein